MHQSKVVGDLKIGYFHFMQPIHWTQHWTHRGLGSLRKALRFQVRYIKSRNSALVHKSNFEGNLNIVVILKLCEGMHISCDLILHLFLISIWFFKNIINIKIMLE